MIDGTHLALFLSAALVLAATPGPGMLYVLGRTLHGGRREGVRSALGTLVGGSVHVVAAAFGLSAILATSAIAFAIVRYAGAAYLIYLGIAMLRSRHMQIEMAAEAGATHGHFLQGITTEVLNPKTALFFLSFIPSVCDASERTPHFTVSASRGDFRVLEHSSRHDRGRSSGSRRSQAQEQSEFHAEAAYRLRPWNDRARHVCRGLEIASRLALSLFVRSRFTGWSARSTRPLGNGKTRLQANE